MPKRKQPSPTTEVEVLTRTARRCAMCFGLEGDLSRKKGQIAHLDHNPANSVPSNLVYLCLDHHDEYDFKTRLTKGVTLLELKAFQSVLLAAVSKGLHHFRPQMPAAPRAEASITEDRRLLNLFLTDFPSDGILRRLAQGTFANPFSRHALYHLNHLLGKWSGAEYTFLANDIDIAKEQLLDDLDAFAGLLALNTFYISNDLAGVSRECGASNAQRDEHYKTTVKTLDQAARDVFAKHQQFIKTARSQLA